VDSCIPDIRDQEIAAMRILYIGQLREGQTALERMKVLKRLGYTIVPFDVSSFANGVSRPLRSIAGRFNMGPILRNINRALTNQTGSLRDVECIWVDKGTWIYPETLKCLKQVTGGQVVHYTPDPQMCFHRSRHFISSIPLYDALVTTKEWEVEAYKKAGAKRVILTHQGYDSRFYPRTVGEPERSSFDSDVCFIGHPERHYAQRLKALSFLNIRLRIWGNGWPRYSYTHPWAKALVREGLWGETYPRALACSKIGLGLLSKWVPETATTRTFEIPAMGTFLLAERTSLHQELFEEGKEADFFSSDEEMQDKTRFYLANQEARQKIAAAGRARCERSGYSSANLMSKIIREISDDL
jgi:spore maturation protein CgeB